MSGNVLGLIIQIIAGILGGHSVGAASKGIDLGRLGNTIAGAIGGGIGGSLLSSILPALLSQGGSLDISALAGQVLGGAAGGAVLTAIIALLKNMMGGHGGRRAT